MKLKIFSKVIAQFINRMTSFSIFVLIHFIWCGWLVSVCCLFVGVDAIAATVVAVVYYKFVLLSFISVLFFLLTSPSSSLLQGAQNTCMLYLSHLVSYKLTLNRQLTLTMCIYSIEWLKWSQTKKNGDDEKWSEKKNTHTHKLLTEMGTR